MRAVHIAALAMLLGILGAGGTAHAEEVRVAKPNLIGGELGGRGLIVTANYERYFNDHIGIGLGIVPGSPLIWTMYVSCLPGDVHSLYLSAGATSFDRHFLGEDLGSSASFDVAVGYQYQSPGGVVIRPFGMLWFAHPLYEDRTWVLPWVGLTIAHSF